MIVPVLHAKEAGVDPATGSRLEKPNILIFYVDDLGWQDVQFNELDTPCPYEPSLKFLYDAAADDEEYIEIVSNVESGHEWSAYKNKPLHPVRRWGRALSSLYLSFGTGRGAPFCSGAGCRRLSRDSVFPRYWISWTRCTTDRTGRAFWPREAITGTD